MLRKVLVLVLVLLAVCPTASAENGVIIPMDFISGENPAESVIIDGFLPLIGVDNNIAIIIAAEGGLDNGRPGELRDFPDAPYGAEGFGTGERGVFGCLFFIENGKLTRDSTSTSFEELPDSVRQRAVVATINIFEQSEYKLKTIEAKQCSIVSLVDGSIGSVKNKVFRAIEVKNITLTNQEIRTSYLVYHIDGDNIIIDGILLKRDRNISFAGNPQTL